MINILNRLSIAIKTALVAAALVIPVLYVAPAYAQISPGAKEAACSGISGASGVSCDASTSGSTLQSIMKTVLGILSWVVGVAAVIMIIVGAFKFVTSNGDSNAIASARNTIIYALIGIFIALVARLLVDFVINRSPR